MRLLDVLSAWLEADPSPAHVMGGDAQWQGWAGASTPANPHLGAPSMDRTSNHPPSSSSHAPSSSGGDGGGDDGDDNVATSRRREVVVVCATNGQ